jgi:uncharacterized protein YecT (DUF1311 family)
VSAPRAVLFAALVLGQLACDREATKAPTPSAQPATTPPQSAEPAPSAAAPSPAPAQAPDEPVAGGWVAICDAADRAQFPPRDLPSAAARAEVEPGDARRFYYGIGTRVDYVRARHAAFVERDRGDTLVIGGSAILMMLYANGQGVKRDLDLAIKLACAVGDAPAEIEGRVMRLQGMKSGGGTTHFDLCDDITSGFMMGHCRALKEEREGKGREHELEALLAKWPAEDREAFDALKSAFDRFVEMRTSNEIDLSGTDRAAAIVEAEATMKQSLLQTLKRAEQGKLSTRDAHDYSKADAELNSAYQRALASDFADSTVSAAGIKATEKAWIRYRDAWVALGARRYPSVPGDAWKTWLTRERIEQLRAF